MRKLSKPTLIPSAYDIKYDSTSGTEVETDAGKESTVFMNCNKYNDIQFVSYIKDPIRYRVTILQLILLQTTLNCPFMT